MNRPLNTSELNSMIRINKFLFGQDEFGGNIKSLTDYFYAWAKLEALSGSRLLDNLQINYTKAFKITTRYEASRPLIPTDEIVYDGFNYVIQSLTLLEEHRKNFNVIVAYTMGAPSNTGDIIVTPPSVSGELVTNEVPEGLIDGSNATFTTEFEFVPESISITINGLEQKSPENYITSGTQTIIFSSSPETGDQILIDYIKA